MAMKTLTCREHGGTFQIEAKRGRPPVRCTEGSPCSGMNVNGGRKRKAANIKAVAERTAQTLRGKLPEPTESATEYIGSYREPGLGTSRNGSRKPVEPRSHPNPCVALAYAARERLEPLGWVVTARGWLDGDSSFASLTASRETELLSLYWQDGVLTDQEYNLWNTEVPAANGKPKTQESFMPAFDEMTDREVVQRLSGMSVQWWNSLGQSVECGTIGETVKITHAYSGTGDEVPGDRVINFIDHDGSGYRSFRMSALMKIGSGK